MMYFGESDGLTLIKNLPEPGGTWELLEVIGGGNYGEVFKGRNCKNGEIAAVKIMDAVLDKEEDIRSELNVFENHCNHPNIVKFFGAFVKRDKREDDQLWIVMEVSSYTFYADYRLLVAWRRYTMVIILLMGDVSYVNT